MNKKGAISIFALLSMMFFLIFIMAAYNNIMQKGKTQVEAKEILVEYYKTTKTASILISSKTGGNVTGSNKATYLKDSVQQGTVTSSNNKYIYSNGKCYKIQ